MSEHGDQSSSGVESFVFTGQSRGSRTDDGNFSSVATSHLRYCAKHLDDDILVVRVLDVVETWATSLAHGEPPMKNSSGLQTNAARDIVCPIQSFGVSHPSRHELDLLVAGRCNLPTFYGGKVHASFHRIN